jgi:hypothetical protein
MARKRARIAVAAQKDSDRRLMQNLSFLVTIAVAVALILLSA